MNSQSDVQQFCFRLTAELDMGYESPPLPVQMRDGPATSFHDMFQTMQNSNTNSNLNTPQAFNASGAPDTPGSAGSNAVYTTPDRNMVDPDVVSG